MIENEEELLEDPVKFLENKNMKNYLTLVSV